MGLAMISGLILWALLQGLQMLPKIILNDPEALLVLMSWVYQFKRVAHKENDSALLRNLKSRFNNLPLEWIESMQQAPFVTVANDSRSTRRQAKSQLCAGIPAGRQRAREAP